MCTLCRKRRASLTEQIPSFLIFPSSFPDDLEPQDTRSTKMASKVALITSLVMIILSTLGSSLLTSLTVSWLFHLDIICIPHLTSSVLGLVNIVYSLADNPSIKLKGRPALALALAVAALLGYAFSALWVFRKIHIVREKEAMHRHVSGPPNTFPLPEDDLQRQQLLRLLSTSQEGKASTLLEHDNQATYKIQWPGGNNAMLASRRDTMNTIRNLPFSRARFGHSRQNSQSCASSPGGMSHHQPPDHFTGGIERLPEIIPEEPTMSSPLNPNSSLKSNPTAPDRKSQAPAVCKPILPAFFDPHPGRAGAILPGSPRHLCLRSHAILSLHDAPVNVGAEWLPVPKA